MTTGDVGSVGVGPNWTGNIGITGVSGGVTIGGGGTTGVEGVVPISPTGMG